MKSFKSIIHMSCLICPLALFACSSHIPPEISKPVAGSPTLGQVLSATDSYTSQSVRWGGVILSTENKQNTSWLTIIAFPLSDKGEPQLSDQSPGRFIAIVEGFLEPLVYSSEREITFTGRLLKTETRNIGDYPYAHPVIQVEHHYLWPLRNESSDYPPYWWYDPWYHPYYPYHPHRYNRY